jgi:glycerophosphoryl diester phosphodiesterase
VLELIAGRVTVNVELKGPDTAAPLASRLGDWPGTEFLVSSFYHSELAHFHELAPGVPTAPLFNKPNARLFDIAESLNAWSINLSRRITSSNLLAEIKRRGYRSLVYTINDPEVARQLAIDGATGIFTDYPDRCGRAALGL